MAAIAVFMMSGTAVAIDNVIVAENNVMTAQSGNVMDKLIAMIKGYTVKINAIKTIDELMVVPEQCYNEMKEFQEMHEDEFMELEKTLRDQQLANYEKKLEKALAEFEAAVEQKIEQLMGNDESGGEY